MMLMVDIQAYFPSVILIPVLPPGPAAFVTKLTTLLFLMLPLVKYISIHKRYLAPGFRSAIRVPVVESRFATLNTLHERNANMY